MYTSAEENYIKGIYKLSEKNKSGLVSTNEIAELMKTKAASVTDMIKKLAQKKILQHRPYQGVQLTIHGEQTALKIIRKHRLWEVFLVDKLDFNWDEVHEIAEQLEHIKSEALIDRLDEFLGFPSYDPHGDPIPSKEGELTIRKKVMLLDMEEGLQGTIVELGDTSDTFLRYLDKIGISLGSKVRVIEKIEFDNSLQLEVNDNIAISVSERVAGNMFVSL